MRTVSALLAALFVFSVTSVWAEPVTELQLLEDFFSQKGVENRSVRLTGNALAEYSNKPVVGEYLPESATTDFRLLSESEGSVIYEVVVSDDGRAQMWSAFFQRGALGSRLEVIETLHIPPYLADVEYPRLLGLQGKSALQLARLTQLRRLFMPTDAFREDFNANRAIYENLAKLVETGKTEEAEAAAKTAGLVGVRLYGESKSEGEMALLGIGKGGETTAALGSEVRIAGYLDSVLGLLHLPTGVTPPLMSPQDYIFVEALADNWFLFRNIAAEPLKDKSVKK